MMRVPRRVLCVDWDRRAVRLVVAKVGGGAIALEDAHSHRVPDDVDVEDPQQIGPLLSELIKLHKWRHQRVIVDVAREKAVINRLAVPPTPQDELAAAVQFQAMRELPFPAEQAAIDFVVTQRNDDGLVTEVLIAAVRKEALQSLQAACAAAGLTPVRIGLRPYANVISLHHLPNLGDEPVMLVDVGPTMTEIDIVHDRSLLFSRAVNVALPPPTPAPADDADGADAAASLSAAAERQAAVRDLEVELTRTLQSYRATAVEATVGRVIVAGGSGYEEELRSRIADRHGLPAELFDPSQALGLSPEEGAQLRSFSAALGLAWGLSREGLLEIDFLNPKRPVSRSETFKRQVTTAGIAAAAVVLVVVGVLVWDHSRKQAQVDALNTTFAELTKQEKDRVLIQTQVERVNEALEVEPVWLDHLLNLTESMVGGDPNRPPAQLGENLLIKQITFDGKNGVVTVDLLARSVEEFSAFEAALHEDFRDGDAQVYRVGEYGYDPDAQEGGFNFKTTFKIALEQIIAAKDRIAAAEKERAKKIKR